MYVLIKACLTSHIGDTEFWFQIDTWGRGGEGDTSLRNNIYIEVGTKKLKSNNMLLLGDRLSTVLITAMYLLSIEATLQKPNSSDNGYGYEW